MFTGIIQAVGKIAAIEPLQEGVRLTVSAADLDMSDVAVGDSIAANGVCLTVIAKTADGYQVDVSRETLNCTEGLGELGEINLEKALRLSDRLGGHLVSGHVDGVGDVVKFAPVGESHELVIRAPKSLARYIAHKGSITVNGVSLTVNWVKDEDFSINLIPHTIEATNFKHLCAGKKVNLEVDLVARYLERMLSYGKEEQ
ncbi:riboflavin synthase subunit alpha [Sulfurimicrobium lacus]|uniref:Riboflavin synthase n=1 Tax=Sulfurimicrobium lacus TaxID=2715678 RepID=A0A6F8V9F5_9PROT|nr:riboflavin synthase [Sulfurimicrobium lacus]BCB25602.1 riboflavin synthase subunit alpha [Sulfurimicrobium lacus]